MPTSLTQRVLIIGWDAADWKIIDALFARGEMGNLKELVERGVRGDLCSLMPRLSPILWTSIATGKTADKHGVLGFIEPEPEGNGAGGGLRLSSSTTRRTKALWNILSQSGKKTAVVNWYASHPAEPINGCVVSNLFQEGMPKGKDEAWKLSAGAVHPGSPELRERIAELRMHPGEVSVQEMLTLVPDLARMNVNDPRLRLLSKLVAQCASVHNVATELLADKGSWDCAMVFYDTIDVVGHHFMQYHPPKMPHVSEPDFAAYKHVMEGVYKLQDAMLGRLLELAGEETTVILLSDHGFHSDHLRPKVQADIHDPHAAMDASWHRPLGVLAIAGPGIQQTQTVYGATLLDIVPTALTLLGLPVGADMDGRVLVEALDRPHSSQGAEIERVFSWDAIDGESGLHSADLRVNPFYAQQALTQLAELGYITAPDASVSQQIAACEREASFNLGVVYMSTGRVSQALPLFEKLHAEYPKDLRFGMNLAHCLQALNRPAEAVAVINQIVTAFPDLPDAQLLRGSALFAQGKIEEAAAALEVAFKASPDRSDLLCSMADAYTHLKRYDQAEAVLDRAEQLEPHDPAIHHKRALLELAREHFEPAATSALRAVELRHFYPEAHYTLGVALTWMKDYLHAIQSFKVALSMQPGMIDAHRYIASIHRHLGDRPSARPHREAAEALLRSRDATSNRSDGAPIAPSVMLEPPMGPQEWARRMFSEDDEVVPRSTTQAPET